MDPNRRVIPVDKNDFESVKTFLRKFGNIMGPQEDIGHCLTDIRRLHGIVFLEFLRCPGSLARVIAMASILPLTICEIYTAWTTAAIINIETAVACSLVPLRQLRSFLVV